MKTSREVSPVPARRRAALAILMGALRAALQWRILVWWLVAMAVPTVVAALPIFRGLATQFNNTPAAAAMARGEQLPLLIDGLLGMRDIAPVVSSSALVAALFALLLSPWLSGMVVASIRVGRTLGMAELLRGGFSEYWRMARMLIWSLIVLAVASSLGGMLSDALGKRAADAILATDAERLAYVGVAVSLLLLAIAHMTLEAGRGALASDAARRSVLRAWGSGVRLVLRRPLASLVIYAGIAIACYGFALLFAWLRVRIGVTGYDAASPVGFVVGLLLSQLIVAMIAWARIARIHGFAALHDETAPRSSAASAPEDAAVRTAEDIAPNGVTPAASSFA